MVVQDSEIERDIISNNLILLNPREILEELRKIVIELKLKNTIFRANHASNYAPIRGTLPKDKEEILSQIDNVLKSKNYRPEFLRGL